jgi:phospholipid/cholesterol/gamma-HCH transport system ATP-binding protein
MSVVLERPRAEVEVVRAAATGLLDVAGELAEAIVAHIEAEMPEFSALDDEFERTFRRAVYANVEEIASLLRAQLPPAAITPVGGLAYGEAARRRGVGLGVLARSYQVGLAVMTPVIDAEIGRAAEQPAVREAVRDEIRVFLHAYVNRLLVRLADAYEAGEPQSLSPQELLRADVAGARAAQPIIDHRRSPEEAAARAREHCQGVLDRFIDTVGAAAADPNLSRRLSRADVTAVVALTDEPELAVTLLLDRTPVEVLDGAHEAECELRIASVDLARLWSEELLLPMAIANGRIAAAGAVRKLLLVWPIIHELARARRDERVRAARVSAPPTEPPSGGSPVAHESGFTAEQRRLLDHAADHVYAFHEGALEVAQSRPGDFWSIECIDVYKRFGDNQVLNGLNLGIPEGMITVILGPSGTGKSVLINHLIGLVYPDAGDILVHGHSVTQMRRRELLAMRRKFGILFQDGALFGSMPIYDNVAFPLREHTNLSEAQIREIVMARLEEVGLGKAADLMPSELSGGMRKRAGFARALVLEPEIVMFDEPDSGLDPVRTALLCRLIHQMHGRHGGTYIVITHDIASMRAIGEYIAVLWRGRIVQSGDREQMLNSENPFVRQFLAGADVGPLGME